MTPRCNDAETIHDDLMSSPQANVRVVLGQMPDRQA
jgi:hypothetical protein